MTIDLEGLRNLAGKKFWGYTGELVSRYNLLNILHIRLIG